MLKVNHFLKTLMLMVATCLVVTANASTNTNNPPSVVITNPAAGQTFMGTVQVIIGASAQDVDGHITSVEFMVNGVSIGTDDSFPYRKGTTLQSGSYTLTAKATDNEGTESYDSIQIYVLKRPRTGIGSVIIGANPQVINP